MAVADPRGEAEVRAAIHEERRQLTESVEELRSGIGEATDVGAKLVRKVAGVALVAGFVLGGGIGATVRYVLRRSR